MFFVGGVIMLLSFFVPGGPTGSGWTLYPPQAITSGTPGSDGGILLMLISLVGPPQAENFAITHSKNTISF